MIPQPVAPSMNVVSGRAFPSTLFTFGSQINANHEILITFPFYWLLLTIIIAIVADDFNNFRWLLSFIFTINYFNMFRFFQIIYTHPRTDILSLYCLHSTPLPTSCGHQIEFSGEYSSVWLVPLEPNLKSKCYPSYVTELPFSLLMCLIYFFGFSLSFIIISSLLSFRSLHALVCVCLFLNFFVKEKSALERVFDGSLYPPATDRQTGTHLRLQVCFPHQTPVSSFFGPPGGRERERERKRK